MPGRDSGASGWRTPAPGQAASLPAWRGSIARPRVRPAAAPHGVEWINKLVLSAQPAGVSSQLDSRHADSPGSGEPATRPGAAVVGVASPQEGAGRATSIEHPRE